MQKPARIPVTVSIPKSLERELRKAGRRQGRPLELVLEDCLRGGLEHQWWKEYADDLIERVDKAHAIPGLTTKQKCAIRMTGSKNARKRSLAL